MSVPVCAGRAGQPRCYNVVTGEPLLMECVEVRGDQLLCGREGKLYEAAEGTSDGDRLDLLLVLVNAYEDEHFGP